MEEQGKHKNYVVVTSMSTGLFKIEINGKLCLKTVRRVLKNMQAIVLCNCCLRCNAQTAFKLISFTSIPFPIAGMGPINEFKKNWAKKNCTFVFSNAIQQ